MFCRSKRAALRVKTTITQFIEEKLHLKVNKVFLERTDEWLRRRIRMCIWKAWKNSKTKIANLKRCGVLDWQAYQWGNTCLGYWRVADSRLVTSAMSNDKLKRAGYKLLCWIVISNGIHAVCRTAHMVV